MGLKRLIPKARDLVFIAAGAAAHWAVNDACLSCWNNWLFGG